MYNINFDEWIEGEVKDILKQNYVDKSLSSQDFTNLLSEVKKEYREYSAHEIDIEDLVNYIVEASSYKDDFKVEYPEWHKYYGTE